MAATPTWEDTVEELPPTWQDTEPEAAPTWEDTVEDAPVEAIDPSWISGPAPQSAGVAPLPDPSSLAASGDPNKQAALLWDATKQIAGLPFEAAALPGKIAYAAAADAQAFTDQTRQDIQIKRGELPDPTPDYGGNLKAMLNFEELPAQKSIDDAAKYSPKLAVAANLAKSAPELASMVAVNPSGAAGRLLALGFSADMVANFKPMAERYAELVNLPPDEQEQHAGEIAQLRAGMLTTFGFAPLAGAHGLSPLEKVPVGPPSQTLVGKVLPDAFSKPAFAASDFRTPPAPVEALATPRFSRTVLPEPTVAPESGITQNTTLIKPVELPVEAAPVESPVQKPVEISGWTPSDARQIGGVNLDSIPPETLAKMKEMGMPVQVEYTDRRTGSPTEGLTVYAPESATPKDVQALIEAKASDAKAKGYNTPSEPPVAKLADGNLSEISPALEEVSRFRPIPPGLGEETLPPSVFDVRETRAREAAADAPEPPGGATPPVPPERPAGGTPEPSGEPPRGTTQSRETGKPTTAMNAKPGVEKMDYIPETEKARSAEADRIIESFGDDLDAALNTLERPPEMSGIPISVRALSGEKIARLAAQREMTGNIGDAQKWGEVRRRADALARSELSQAGQTLQTGAQIARDYAETGAGVVSAAENQFTELKKIDKDFPDLSPETKKKIYDLANRADELNKLSDKDKAGKTEAEQEVLLRQKKALTSRERMRLRIQIETELASEKLKNGWRGWLTPEGRKARAMAMNEVITANLLATPTFLVKQPIDVASQLAYHSATRALAQVISLPRKGSVGERAGQFVSDSAHEVISSLKDVINSRQAAMRYGIEGLKGRGSQFRETLGFSQDMRFIERAEKQIQDAIASKQYWKAIWPMYKASIRIGISEARFLDELTGTLVENTEIRQQVEKGLRDMGETPESARQKARDAVGNLVAEYSIAENQARLMLGDANVKVPKGEFKAMVWDLAHLNALERVRALNLNPELIEGDAVRVGRTFAWNQREIGAGPGGNLMGKPLESIKQYLESLGVPSPFTAFANAISIGSNRALTNAGLGLFPGLFKGSDFYKTPKDVTQRKIEASVGLAITGLFAIAAYNGMVRVRNRLSSDPDERQKQSIEGRKGGTVEFNAGDGKFVPISMSTGPLAVFRIPLSIIGAWQDLHENREKRDIKAAEKAEKLGLKVGSTEDKSDLMGVLLGAAANGAFGGRTLGGLQGAMIDQNAGLDYKQPISSAVSATVPLLPWTKASERVVGVEIDNKRASLLSMVFPSSLSDGKFPRLNDWGEPVNPKTFDRAIGTLTGGTVPWPVDIPKDDVMRVAIGAGWSPPAFSDKLYEHEDETLGKMSNEQRNAYLRKRGELLRKEIESEIKFDLKEGGKNTAEDWREIFDSIIKDADAEALEAVKIVPKQ